MKKYPQKNNYLSSGVSWFLIDIISPTTIGCSCCRAKNKQTLALQEKQNLSFSVKQFGIKGKRYNLPGS